MPHINIEENNHDHTVSAYIVRTDTPEPTLLLHMHRRIKKLLQPGGHIELTESPWQSLTHEIPEETGYQIGELQILQPTDHPQIKLKYGKVHPQPICHNTQPYTETSTHYHTDSVYAFITDHPPMNLPGDGESVDLRWVTLEQLLAMPTTLVGATTQTIGEQVLTHFINVWEPVNVTLFD